MKQSRISRKRVEKTLESASTKNRHYRLIWSEYLHENSTTFKYKIVEDEPKYTDFDFAKGEVVIRNYQTGWKFKREVTEYTTLKECYKVCEELLDIAIKEADEEIERLTKGWYGYDSKRFS